DYYCDSWDSSGGLF
nr:immunoglobulin light chain junction region [Macaca mulatta]